MTKRHHHLPVCVSVSAGRRRRRPVQQSRRLARQVCTRSTCEPELPAGELPRPSAHPCSLVAARVRRALRRRRLGQRYLPTCRHVSASHGGVCPPPPPPWSSRGDTSAIGGASSARLCRIPVVPPTDGRKPRTRRPAADSQARRRRPKRRRRSQCAIQSPLAACRSRGEKIIVIGRVTAVISLCPCPLTAGAADRNPSPAAAARKRRTEPILWSVSYGCHWCRVEAGARSRTRRDRDTDVTASRDEAADRI